MGFEQCCTAENCRDGVLWHKQVIISHAYIYTTFYSSDSFLIVLMLQLNINCLAAISWSFCWTRSMLCHTESWIQCWHTLWNSLRMIETFLLFGINLFSHLFKGTENMMNSTCFIMLIDWPFYIFQAKFDLGLVFSLMFTPLHLVAGTRMSWVKKTRRSWSSWCGNKSIIWYVVVRLYQSCVEKDLTKFSCESSFPSL